MRNLRLLAILPMLAPFALAYACGGETPTPESPVKPPETAIPSVTASAPPSASAAVTPSATATEPPKPVEPPFAITVVNVKFAPDKGAKNVKAMEIKDDGSVSVDGKVKVKFVKDEIQDGEGKALGKLSKDGAFSMGEKSYGKFDDKDVLTLDGGGTIAIGDDGTVKITEKDGKASKTLLGKFDKLDAKGKRAAILIAVATLEALKAPPPKKDDVKKDDGKKDGGKKDDGKKDAPKDAGKKDGPKK